MYKNNLKWWRPSKRYAWAWNLLMVGVLCVGMGSCEKEKVKVKEVSLDKTHLILTVGDFEKLTATVEPPNADNQLLTWSSSKPNVAAVDDDGNVSAVSVGTATITVETQDGEHSASCEVTVWTGEPTVEINGVTWATCNVDKPGTFAVTPADAGMFYQWNRKIGYSSTDPLINSSGSTLWDNSTPSGATWQPANDPSPAGFRVPTIEEINSLTNKDKVSSEWTFYMGTSGRMFTDKTTNKSLFLPAARMRFYNSEIRRYAEGHYWQGTKRYNTSFYEFTFDEDYYYWDDVFGSGQYNALPIRSVVNVKPSSTYSWNGETSVTINGVTWATRNVGAFGAFADKPENLGEVYEWNNGNGWSYQIWENSNDPSPAGFRIPTVDELETLLDGSRVFNQPISYNGVNGRLFTDKVTNKSLFLPGIDEGTTIGVNIFFSSSTVSNHSSWIYIFQMGSGVDINTVGVTSYSLSEYPEFFIRPIAE